jgi:hypothetical protein
MLPLDEVRINPVTVNNIGLVKSIYTREQLEEFSQFQDSQGTRKAYLAETAEMAYIRRNEKGEWRLALGSAAQVSLIDLVGVNFFPLYRVVGPMVFFLSLLLLVWGGLRLMKCELDQQVQFNSWLDAETGFMIFSRWCLLNLKK